MVLDRRGQKPLLSSAWLMVEALTSTLSFRSRPHPTLIKEVTHYSGLSSNLTRYSVHMSLNHAHNCGLTGVDAAGEDASTIRFCGGR